MYHDTIRDPYHLEQRYFGCCYDLFLINVHAILIGKVQDGYGKLNTPHHDSEIG